MVTTVTPQGDENRVELARSVLKMKKEIASINEVCFSLVRRYPLQSILLLLSFNSNEERDKAIRVMQKAASDLETTLLLSEIGSLEIPGAYERTQIQQTQLEAKDLCKQTSLDIKTLVTAVKTGTRLHDLLLTL